VLLTIGVIKLIQGIRRTPDNSGESGESGKSGKSEKCSGKFGDSVSLRAPEAAIIAAGLSLDGLAAGFGAALGGVNGVVMLGSSLLAHMAAIPLGCMLGRLLSAKSRCNIAWFGGAVIIILAFMQLL
jgi:putative Mn2+ efflux pump MntP